MDSFKEKIEKEAFKIFQNEKVMTIDQIAKNLGKSISTTRIKLKQWQAITSWKAF